MPDNPTTASPVTRSAEVQELMEGLKYAGYSFADKDGNWKMVWFKPLIDYIAHLEFTHPQAARTLSEILQYNEMSDALRERLKLLLNSMGDSPKPQSDEGKEDWDAARAWFKHRFNGDSTKWTLGEVAFLAGMFNEHRALSRQAPVPTTSGGKAHE